MPACEVQDEGPFTALLRRQACLNYAGEVLDAEFLARPNPMMAVNDVTVAIQLHRHKDAIGRDAVLQGEIVRRRQGRHQLIRRRRGQSTGHVSPFISGSSQLWTLADRDLDNSLDRYGRQEAASSRIRADGAGGHRKPTCLGIRTTGRLRRHLRPLWLATRVGILQGITRLRATLEGISKLISL